MHRFDFGKAGGQIANRTQGNSFAGMTLANIAGADGGGDTTFKKIRDIPLRAKPKIRMKPPTRRLGGGPVGDNVRGAWKERKWFDFAAAQTGRMEIARAAYS
eukprot:430371-Rhodomonas_salina.3